ncbi:MAG TPA: patatin-like phospholipase family protein [Acidimicrobiales bacterium]|nr:patatin-like phospholipase family protein [Acidimicrobiales bacterium]
MAAPEKPSSPPGDPGQPAPEEGRLPGGVFVAPGAPRRWLARQLRGIGTRRRPRTAFVFAGGSSRGAAQIGMAQALVARGITADAVYGASVGAINAAGYAGDPTEEGVERLAAIWRRLTRDDIFPQSRVPTALRYFQQRESVHPNTALRKVIEEGITFEQMEQAVVHLEVVATSLHDGHTRWFASGPAPDRILASAALPALLPPVEIDGESFIDGGVVDNVPIGRAMSEGAERIFVLLCGPLHYTPNRYRRPVEAVLTAFFIAVHTRFVRELARLPEGVEVVVFTVDSEPVSRYDDFSGTEALIDAGRANAEAVLDFWQAGGLGDRLRPVRTVRAPRRSALVSARDEAV